MLPTTAPFTHLILIQSMAKRVRKHLTLLLPKNRRRLLIGHGGHDDNEDEVCIAGHMQPSCFSVLQNDFTGGSRRNHLLSDANLIQSEGMRNRDCQQTADGSGQYGVERRRVGAVEQLMDGDTISGTGPFRHRNDTGDGAAITDMADEVGCNRAGGLIP
ncbi:hypothetical protein Rleg9DRAFT_5858 [Rhizobium leguminosarum bv. trifolii WSM597]|uniref:Uncharacterized protein n=2 Tax=Rhizobium leguminosarum bv. trifolii TaxID=386 RepID=A0ABF7QVC6_RHILW|nr:hypothetical protein Rleg2_4866 [Rhizobium leguminosarum bv. trifolii WSM2304]EJB06894.1 hypothetical protein Rleg9DRAFT_5858 [Rhizobium leguminosarum bv. trifolii WSM597]